jgi:hypothetical protein
MSHTDMTYEKIKSVLNSAEEYRSYLNVTGTISVYISRKMGSCRGVSQEVNYALCPQTLSSVLTLTVGTF